MENSLDLLRNYLMTRRKWGSELRINSERSWENGQNYLRAHNLKAAGSNPAPATPSLPLRNVRAVGSSAKFHFVIFSSEDPKMLLRAQNRAATMQRISLQTVVFFTKKNRHYYVAISRVADQSEICSN